MSATSPSLGKAFGWSVVQHWGARAISFVVFFLLARLLRPADFGLVAIAAIVIGFTDLFADQGFGDAIVQSADESDIFLSTAFWVNIASASVLVVILLCSANYIAVLFKSPGLAPITRVLSVTLILTALSSVQISLLRRRMDYRSLAMRTTLANLISGVVACALAFAGFGVWSLVIQQIVYGIVSTAVVWRTGAFRPSLKASPRAYPKLIHFGIKVCGIRTLDLMHTKLIDSLVGIYLGTVALGLYSVGSKLAMILMQLLGSSVADVSLSHFSDLHRSNGNLSAAYLKMLRRLSFSAVPIFVFLALDSRALVHLIFGQKWDAATPVFASMCISGSVQVLIFFSNSVINAVGRPGIQLILSLVKLTLFAIGFFIFKSSGIATISWSLAAITILITAPATLFVLARLLCFPLSDLFVALWLPYACVLTAAGTAYKLSSKLPPESLQYLLWSSFIFVTVFVTICLLLDAEARWITSRLIKKTFYRRLNSSE